MQKNISSHHTLGPSHTKKFNYKKTKNTIIISIFLVAIFMSIEFIGGYLSNSIALIADAFHMLTDLISLILALIGLKISQKKNNYNKTYGYSRFEMIISLLNSIFLILVCIYISYESIMRFFNPVAVNAIIMFPVACIGFIFNIIIMYIFYKSEENNRKHAQSENKNLLMESAIMHFLADTMGSIIVIITSITIYYTNWFFIDPFLSLILVALISRGTFKIISHSIHILMEGSPNNIKASDIETHLEKTIDGVLDIHHIHLWMLNEQENIITLHAVISEDANYYEIIKNIKKELKSVFNIEHSTIQVQESKRV